MCLIYISKLYPLSLEHKALFYMIHKSLNLGAEEVKFQVIKFNYFLLCLGGHQSKIGILEASHIFKKKKKKELFWHL